MVVCNSFVKSNMQIRLSENTFVPTRDGNVMATPLYYSSKKTLKSVKANPVPWVSIPISIRLKSAYLIENYDNREVTGKFVL